MTTFAAPPTSSGVTLVGELVGFDDAASRTGSGRAPDVSHLSVRWLGVTVQTSTDTTVAASTGPVGPVGSASPVEEGGPADAAAPTPPRPHGLRGLTEGIRRLIDGPPGRHRRPHRATTR